MKSIIAASAVFLAASAFSGQVHAAGCVSGAAVGGVAGHVAGHHGLLGAAAGCAVGHHMNVKQKQNAAASQTATQPQ